MSVDEEWHKSINHYLDLNNYSPEDHELAKPHIEMAKHLQNAVKTAERNNICCPHTGENLAVHTSLLLVEHVLPALIDLKARHSTVNIFKKIMKKRNK